MERLDFDFSKLLWQICKPTPVYEKFTPTRILKSGNRTIVFWGDGTKTIVKRSEDEQDNAYAAFTAALGIKVYGSNSALKRIVARTETQKPKVKKTDIVFDHDPFDDYLESLRGEQNE